MKFTKPISSLFALVVILLTFSLYIDALKFVPPASIAKFITMLYIVLCTF